MARLRELCQYMWLADRGTVARHLLMIEADRSELGLDATSTRRDRNGHKEKKAGDAVLQLGAETGPELRQTTW